MVISEERNQLEKIDKQKRLLLILLYPCVLLTNAGNMQRSPGPFFLAPIPRALHTDLLSWYFR